ncbi:MAG: MBL fold metallo-hydrolase [Oscillatoriales cyanobacterium SM2_2_1]|nr:MBL fold metallo-hydrolase [Oscillatoriales cyanobacterium SM2_2_1]
MIHRRHLLQRVLPLGMLSTAAAIATAQAQNRPPAPPSTNPKSDPKSLQLRWFGHFSFLISGGNARILTHPFRAAGCTAGLSIPRQDKDLVLISSRLLDEGFLNDLPPDTQVLSDPGSYTLAGLSFQGIRMSHDRVNGRRFGTNIAWRWQQAGIRLLHLGGAAAPLTSEQRLLMGQPDVLILPVGGGPKAYTAAEAKEVATQLNPRLIIPVHFRLPRAAASCDLAGVEEFLSLMPAEQVQRLKTNTLSLTANKLPAPMNVRVLSL